MQQDGEQGSSAGTVDMSFTRSLQEYIAVDDEIKRLSTEAKGLRKNKNVLEDAISSHMLDNELDEGKCEDATVRVVKKKKSTNTFTRSNVQQCALTLLGAEKTDALVRMIDDLKETTESHGIKRLRAS